MPDIIRIPGGQKLHGGQKQKANEIHRRHAAELADSAWFINEDNFLAEQKPGSPPPLSFSEGFSMMVFGQIVRFNLENLSSCREVEAENVMTTIMKNKSKIFLMPFLEMGYGDVFPFLANVLNTPILAVEIVFNSLGRLLQMPALLFMRSTLKLRKFLKTGPGNSQGELALKVIGKGLLTIVDVIINAISTPCFLIGKVCGYTRALVDGVASFLNPRFAWTGIVRGVDRVLGFFGKKPTPLESKKKNLKETDEIKNLRKHIEKEIHQEKTQEIKSKIEKNRQAIKEKVLTEINKDNFKEEIKDQLAKIQMEKHKEEKIIEKTTRHPGHKEDEIKTQVEKDIAVEKVELEEKLLNINSSENNSFDAEVNRRVEKEITDQVNKEFEKLRLDMEVMIDKEIEKKINDKIFGSRIPVLTSLKQITKNVLRLGVVVGLVAAFLTPAGLALGAAAVTVKTGLLATVFAALPSLTLIGSINAGAFKLDLSARWAAQQSKITTWLDENVTAPMGKFFNNYIATPIQTWWRTPKESSEIRKPQSSSTGFLSKCFPKKKHEVPVSQPVHQQTNTQPMYKTLVSQYCVPSHNQNNNLTIDASTGIAIATGSTKVMNHLHQAIPDLKSVIYLPNENTQPTLRIECHGDIEKNLPKKIQDESKQTEALLIIAARHVESFFEGLQAANMHPANYRMVPKKGTAMTDDLVIAMLAYLKHTWKERKMNLPANEYLDLKNFPGIQITDKYQTALNDQNTEAAVYNTLGKHDAKQGSIQAERTVSPSGLKKS